MGYDPDEVLLTRSEAARYKGLSNESAVRDAENRGAVQGTKDENGRTLYRVADLDAWKTKARGKVPTEAAQQKIVHDAYRARQKELCQEDAKQDRQQVEVRRAETDSEAQRRALVQKVEEENRQALERFRADFVSEPIARATLGDRWHTVRHALAEERAPLQRAVRGFGGTDDDPVRVETTGFALVSGTFYRRADVETLARARRDESGVLPTLRDHEQPRIDDANTVLAAALKRLLNGANHRTLE